MKAIIVTIGDEILIGQITDTNSGFIAKSLNKIGIEIIKMVSIGDDKQVIVNTLSSCEGRADLVIITGGLGPTKDDLTKKAFCDFFEDQLIVDQKVLTHVVEMIENIFRRPASQLNKDQALVPSKSTVLFNEVGTAPGMWAEKNNTIFISLPGVPYEMKYLMEKEVISRLITRFKRPYIIHKTIVTHGIGESLLAERIADWEDDLPNFIKLGYLPDPNYVRLRLSARGTQEAVLQDELYCQVEKLQELIGEAVVGYDDHETLEVVLGGLLAHKKRTIATAESCTGGKIAQTLAAISGASVYFKGSIVCYTTETKVSVLGVSQDLITSFSVVSKEVAEAMALCAQQKFKTDYAIATTGNAGPTKGDSNAALGTVIIAYATPNGVYSEEFNFGQPREKVIDKVVGRALEKIYQEIIKN